MKRTDVTSGIRYSPPDRAIARGARVGAWRARHPRARARMRSHVLCARPLASEQRQAHSTRTRVEEKMPLTQEEAKHLRARVEHAEKTHAENTWRDWSASKYLGFPVLP